MPSTITARGRFAAVTMVSRVWIAAPLPVKHGTTGGSCAGPVPVAGILIAGTWRLAAVLPRVPLAINGAESHSAAHGPATARRASMSFTRIVDPCCSMRSVCGWAQVARDPLGRHTWNARATATRSTPAKLARSVCVSGGPITTPVPEGRPKRRASSIRWRAILAGARTPGPGARRRATSTRRWPRLFISAAPADSSSARKFTNLSLGTCRARTAVMVSMRPRCGQSQRASSPSR